MSSKPVRKLYVRTPLVESRPLSVQSGVNVYLKLENTQPTDSFKVRGQSYHIQKEIARGCTRLVSSSSGNGGLAAAYVGRKLNIPMTIYTPEYTSLEMRQRMELEGATVIVHGKNWNIANDKAVEEAKDLGCAFSHPYDHPNIWEGIATMVEEIYEDLDGIAPDLIVLSVGGGGLLCGVVTGLDRVGWSQVQILAMETIGADCLNQAVKAGHPVCLPDITSVAKSLGSLQVAEQAFAFSKSHNIISEIITDQTCVNTCLKFADDHRYLVEPSCGAAVSAFYTGLIKQLQEEGRLTKVEIAVLIVCGGHAVTYPMLLDLKKQLENFLY